MSGKPSNPNLGQGPRRPGRPKREPERVQIERTDKGWGERKNVPHTQFDKRLLFDEFPRDKGNRKTTVTRIGEPGRAPYANNAEFQKDVLSLQPGGKPLHVRILLPYMQKGFSEMIISFEAKEMSAEGKMQLAGKIHIRQSDIGHVIVRRVPGGGSGNKPGYYLELKTGKGATTLYRIRLSGPSRKSPSAQGTPTIWRIVQDSI